MGIQKRLSAGEFVVIAEMSPPKGIDITRMVTAAQRIRGRVDAVAVPDMENGDAEKILRSPSSGKALKFFLDRLNAADSVDEEQFDELVRETARETGVKGKSLYQPIRIAITGRIHGPELKQVVPIIGKEGCIKRLKRALN